MNPCSKQEPSDNNLEERHRENQSEVQAVLSISGAAPPEDASHLGPIIYVSDCNENRFVFYPIISFH